ncbi:LOW QUALITY PROTEIN: hypothetical protein CRUP_013930 [Coryphaenoides rupestris]|nr:LOW QUALITY PROTEIN: hypothetical protein CRUP_013930 [Coryphaenoides rupestris]
MTEVAGPWVEVLEETEGEDDSFLMDSTLTLDLLVDEPPATQHAEPRSPTRSQPITITPASYVSPAQSPVLIGSVPPPSSDQHLIKVFGEDSYSRSLWVSRGATAKEVCHLLVQTAHCSDQENWALIEFHPSRGLERCLEDHEVVLQSRPPGPSRQMPSCLFRKNYAKYEFFRTPATLLRSGSCPEIQGFPARSPAAAPWKRVYFLLRRSGLYCLLQGLIQGQLITTPRPRPSTPHPPHSDHDLQGRSRDFAGPPGRPSLNESGTAASKSDHS